MNIEARFAHLSAVFLPEILERMGAVVRDATPDGSSLERMCTYHLETGGKRLRALIPLLIADVLDSDPSRLVPFGAACELLHNATLVHDDIQDGDDHRRGMETVWRRFGVAQAINLGDAMFYYAVRAVQGLDVEGDVRDRVLSRLVTETIRVIDGQEREFALKQDPCPTIEDYLDMVAHKTSGLFRLPMAGALDLCGAEGCEIEGIGVAANHLGILFQVQDDILDLYGDKGRGARGSDVAEGKRSYMVVHALERLEGAGRSRLVEILDLDRSHTGSEHVAEIVALFDACGALDAARGEIGRRRMSAREAVAGVSPALEALVDGLAELFIGPIRHLVE